MFFQVPVYDVRLEQIIHQEINPVNDERGDQTLSWYDCAATSETSRKILIDVLHEYDWCRTRFGTYVSVYWYCW